MTEPCAETLEREKDKLYLTDAELIRRLGVPANVLRPILPNLEAKFGFPEKSALFGGRRYWPAVKAWLDRHEGLTMPVSQITRGNAYDQAAGAENRGRSRHRLARPQGRMGRDLAG
jgi:hypothetical protein